MKTLIIDGRLGADAEIKTSKSGRQYITFNIANNEYVNGETKTEWYTVISYNPYAINTQMKVLKKGRYAICTGRPTTDVNVDRTNKVWVNQFMFADTIDTPSFGVGNGQKKESVAEGMSTFTGGTPSEQMAQAAPTPQPAYATEPMTTGYVPSTPSMSATEDDDLPF